MWTDPGWPNAGRTARYVIWRRVEAWGWYTRQAGQTWPGFANANEVGVYPPPSAALSPVDSAGDGLADWLEDANGDGLVGANETDPNNPVSRPETGRLDGEWWAERSPELRVGEYRNDSALWWANPINAPDVWFELKRCSWRPSKNRAWGNYPRRGPPPSYLEKGDARDRPAVGPGTLFTWLVDAQGQVLIQVPRNGYENVTPTIPHCPWDQGQPARGSHTTVRLTWSRHPACSPVDLQGLFDQGAWDLAEDGDTPIRDDDPRLSDPNVRIRDAVPTYLDFFISKALWSTFPPTWVFRGKPLAHEIFSNLREWEVLGLLRRASFANIKLVNTIYLGGVPHGGRGLPGVPGIVLAMKMGPDPYVAYLDWLSAIHEFGHPPGLEHRGHQDNPGDANDPTAILHRLHGGGTEVNRTERDKFVRPGTRTGALALRVLE